MIDVVIPENCFIIFNCGLVHCETPAWFISRGEYSSNTRVFFTMVETYFNLRNEITVQIDNELCSMKTCDVCKNNKYGTIKENSPLIDLRLVRKYNVKINENKKG